MRRVVLVKFKTGKLENGMRVEGKEVEYDCWFDAIEAVLAEVNLYLYELDEEGNEVV